MKKVLALVLSMAMLFTGIPATAFAADSSAKEPGMTVTMLHETKDQPSMCDQMFAEKADLVNKGDNVEVKIYVANPVPGFPDQGADGTVKNFKITYNGKVYTAESDITTKPMMTAKADNALFGLKGGEKYSAQVLSVTLPKEAVKEGSTLKVDTYVNVVMNSDQTFRLQMSDVVLPEEEKEEEQAPEAPAYGYGKTHMDISMLNQGKDTPSICNDLFAVKADLVSDGEDALVSLYVAYPVPGFPKLGEDGTLKDFVATYNGTKYAGESDITTKPVMITRGTNPMFGTTKDAEIPAQVITFRLPKEALKSDVLIPVTAYVNVVMNKTVEFRMQMSNIVIPEADKTELNKAIEAAKAETGKNYTEASVKALMKAIEKAEAVAENRNATDKDVAAAVSSVNNAVKGLEKAKKPVQEAEKPDYRNLEDGVYAVQGKMVKPSGAKSMSDDAINHNIKLTVKDGKYSLTMNFRGISMGDKFGYLGELEYFLTGYTKDQYNSPVGKTGKATVEKLIRDKDGKVLVDQYGTDYPDIVTFEMIPEALEDGMVPLQVNVPVMESIAPGLGVQQVYLDLDWSTVKMTTADNEIFEPEEDEMYPEDMAKPEAGKDAAGTTGTTGTAGADKAGKAPVTGDEAAPYMWALVLLAAGTAVFGLRRKMEK